MKACGRIHKMLFNYTQFGKRPSPLAYSNDAGTLESNTTKRRRLASDTLDLNREGMNAKGVINNWKQMHGKDVIYQQIDESGPDHRKIFTCAVIVNDQTIAEGTGSTIKAAEQEAAKNAVNTLQIKNGTNELQCGENPKSELNEMLQAEQMSCHYESINRKGPDHRPIFTVQLVINSKVVTTGKASKKKDAERSAALGALRMIREGHIHLQRPTNHNGTTETIYNRSSTRDSKCILNDWVQSKRKSIEYKEKRRFGPDHNLCFEVDLFIDGIHKTSGRGNSLQKAEEHASNKAIKDIAEERGPYYPTENIPRFPGISFYDELATIAHKTFESVTHNAIVSIGKETVIAAIIMEDCSSQNKTVISIGSGNVFIDKEHLSTKGENVIDSHAEIIAARGFRRFMLKEVNKIQRNSNVRGSVFRLGQHKKIQLKDGIKFHMYISKAPCGDGSIFTLNANGSHCENGSTHRPIICNKKQGLLRAKIAEGEGAIPLSEFPDERLHKMSCSDKICKWNVVGVQGALLSKLTDRPIYLSSIVVGDVYNFQHLSRALCCRIKSQHAIPTNDTMSVNHPNIGISTAYDAPELGKAKPVSINWNIADDTVEVTNGRTGKIYPELYLSLPEKGQLSSRLCKKQFLNMYRMINVCSEPNGLQSGGNVAYRDVKMSSEQYQDMKTKLYDLFREKGYGDWKRHDNVDSFK